MQTQHAMPRTTQGWDWNRCLVASWLRLLSRISSLLCFCRLHLSWEGLRGKETIWGKEWRMHILRNETAAYVASLASWLAECWSELGGYYLALPSDTYHILITVQAASSPREHKSNSLFARSHPRRAWGQTNTMDVQVALVPRLKHFYFQSNEVSESTVVNILMNLSFTEQRLNLLLFHPFLPFLSPSLSFTDKLPSPWNTMAPLC